MKPLNLFICLILLATSAYASRKGNGGDAITCNGKTELLDYYEGREQLRYDQFHFGSGTTELEVAQYLLNKLDRDLIRYTFYKRWLDSFMSETKFVRRNLQDIPDHGYIFHDSNCKITQAAIQVDPESRTDKKRYIIHKPTWDKMDVYNRAGLILHELIYREAVEVRIPDSRGVRSANAYLASREQHPSSLEDIKKAVENDVTIENQQPFFYAYNKKNVRSPLRPRYGAQPLEEYGIPEFNKALRAFNKAPKIKLSEGHDILRDSDKPFLLMHLLDLDKKDRDDENNLRFRSKFFKERISKEKDILIKSLLIKGGFSDYRKNDGYIFSVFDEIANSHYDDFTKSLSAHYMIELLYFKYKGETSSEHYENFKEVYPEHRFKSLLTNLLTKFKLLMYNHSSYPFYIKADSTSSHQYGYPHFLFLNRVQGFLAWPYPKAFKEVLESALVRNVKLKNKYLFTNIVTFLERFHYREIKRIKFSNEFFQKIWDSEGLYLYESEDQYDVLIQLDENSFRSTYRNNSIWTALRWYAPRLNEFELRKLVSDCYQAREKFEEFNKGLVLNDCERLLRTDRSNSAHKITLSDRSFSHFLSFWEKASLLKPTDYLYGPEFGSNPQSYMHDFREEMSKILIFNVENNSSRREELNDVISRSLISYEEGQVTDYHLDIYALSKDLKPNSLNALMFAFDLQLRSFNGPLPWQQIQEDILLRVFKVQNKLSSRIINWVISIAHGDYGERVRAAAVEVLRVHK